MPAQTKGCRESSEDSAFPGHGTAAFGTFGFKAGHAAAVGFPVPASQADAGASGAAAKAAAPAGASSTAAGAAALALAPSGTAALSAALSASWASLLCIYCHFHPPLRGHLIYLCTAPDARAGAG